ncbi:MAG TPA: PD-(D/E)XK nuclease domain-containing protein, partial [Leptospiraceae bacterium]|nr:PD-(D/E)XK nuclease domain-containing protein [Leptospiraceae bacterium]
LPPYFFNFTVQKMGETIVKHAFLNYFFRKIQKFEETTPSSVLLSRAFTADDLDRCMEILREIFLSIDYDLHIPLERYYQTVFYLIFTLLGFRIQAEAKTNKGWIDAVVISKSIYIFEFKLNGTKEETLSQIKDKKYYEKYISKGKPIVLVGVEFKDRDIGDYLTETL